MRGLTLTVSDQPGFWEGYGYHNPGDPWLEQRYSEIELAHRHPRRGDRRNPPGQDPHLRRARLGRSPRGSIDVLLTAEDGDQAHRSCSVASAPEDERLALTVERLPD